MGYDSTALYSALAFIRSARLIHTVSEFYRVLKLRSDSPELVEQLGSKPKFWFWLRGDTERPWLFKYAREGTGEHWSEKVAAEVAQALLLPAAQVDLAEFNGKRGIASRSFVPRHAAFDLVHGDELLAGHVIGYDRTKTFRHSSHSVSNIVQAISAVFPDPLTREMYLTRFAGYLLLDALIGNTDRHHQNWGVLRCVMPDGTASYELAPTFDHASSLGRNEPEGNLRRRLNENTILSYARKGRGGIYWLSADTKGENPLKLVENAAARWPGYFRPWLQLLHLLDHDTFRSVVARIPPDWMSETQKEFCIRFLTETSSELRKLPL